MRRFSLTSLIGLAFFFVVYAMARDSQYAHPVWISGTTALCASGFLYKRTSLLSFLAIALISLYCFCFDLVQSALGFNLSQVVSEALQLTTETNIPEVVTFIKNIVFEQTMPLLLIAASVPLLFMQSPLKSRLGMAVCAIATIGSFSYVVTRSDFTIGETWAALHHHERDVQASKAAMLEKARFRWASRSAIAGPSTIVIVLGETTRGDHFSINGYPRDTNPHLSQDGLISFKHAISNGPYTSVSTPMILTRKPVSSTLAPIVWNETSLIAAYKEAGYATYYISYLGQFHSADDTVNQITGEADHYIERPWDGKGGDEAGAQIIQQILRQDPSPKKLIIYKLVGSHFNFQDRYPKSFDVFQPSFQTVHYTEPSPSERDVLVNTYDNTLLYTDFVVDKIINVLRQESEDTFLSFISDHGTALYEDGKTIYVGNTQANYRIPLFFWFNTASRSRLGPKLDWLARNTDKPVDATYFVDTMFDLSGLDTRVRKGKTLVTQDLEVQPRRVISGNEVVDYNTLPP